MQKLGSTAPNTDPRWWAVSPHIYSKKPRTLLSASVRGLDPLMPRWTTEDVSGKRLPVVTVCTLMSRSAFSAAESFTFGLRVNHRVTIVAVNTGGGGDSRNFVQLATGFYMFVPRGRTNDPKTNEGWEAEGIIQTLKFRTTRR